MTISGKEVPAIPDVLIEDADLRNILIALKTIAEIREGRLTDKKQRFITYYELVNYLRGTDQLVVEAVTGGHNHNSLYSLLAHNHNLLDLAERAYSSLTGAPYIPAVHSDLTDDESTKHRLINDSGALATELWSAAKITAELALLSLAGHNHNLADLAEKAYASLTGKPTIPSVHSDLTDNNPEKHRLINDSGSTATELWSAAKIIAEMALLPAADHNHNLADLAEKAYASLTGTPTIPSAHSDLSDDEAEKHRLINDAGALATELWSASKISTEIALYSLATHNHNLADLAERAYSSLTGTPTIPAAHSDLSDDESKKHRLIDDVGSSTTVLWSASKIITELASYALSSHNHNLIDLTERAYTSLTGTPTIPSAHSDLSDDEAEKHRLINDSGTTATELWSAAKIIASLALYSLDGHDHDSDYSAADHNHNLNDLTEKDYSSLTGQPTSHSDFTDDESEKHRLINDAGTALTELWSASRLDSLITALDGLVSLNTTHSTGDGSDHTDVATNTTHATGDGSDHSDVASNTSHAAGSGSDHSDVSSNTTARHTQNTDSQIIKNDTWILLSDSGTDGEVAVVVDNDVEMDITDGGVRLGGAGARVAAILDQDDLSDDDSAALATQQSIKAYVDRLNVVNYVDNGDFDVAQLGTSFTNPASGADTLDRWRWYSNSGASQTVTQATDVPTFAQSGHHSTYSLKMDVTVAETPGAATDYEYFSYLMEGYDYAKLHGRKCVLSFWVKSTKTGTFCVSFQNGAADRSYIVEVTVSSSDTWEKVEIPIEFDASGTWDFTNGTGLYINWALQVGSNAYGTAGSWISTGHTVTSNQDNFHDSASNNFLLSQVQLEIGEVASNFKPIPFADTLARCMRYIERSYSYGIAIGAAAQHGIAVMMASATTMYQAVPFKVSKRATPTVTVYSPVSGNSGAWYDYYGSVDDTTGLSAVAGLAGFYGYNASSVNGRAYGFHWVAKALLT